MHGIGTKIKINLKKCFKLAQDAILKATPVQTKSTFRTLGISLSVARV
jgi:hypothetical protein